MMINIIKSCSIQKILDTLKPTHIYNSKHNNKMIKMGKTGYIKCKELIESLIEREIKEISVDELKTEIAKQIGFSMIHNTVDNYYKALILFDFIKPIGDNKVQIIYENDKND